MKKLLNFKYNIHIILVLFICSCTDEDPCPRCFEDIITCKVNGKVWQSNCISTDPLFGCRAINCHYSYNEEKGLSLEAGNSKNSSGLTLDQGSAWGGAKLGVNSIEQNEIRFINFNLTENCSRLDFVDFSYKNYFILDKIDTTKYILEGRFGFKVYNNCGDTATITDGYFKTKFLF